MQEMIQIKPVTTGIPPGISFRGRMDPSQRCALCPRVSGCAGLWTSPLNMAEQHHWTLPFRKKPAGKKCSIPRRHRGSNWYANLVKIRQELRFPGNVGLASNSATR